MKQDRFLLGILLGIGLLVVAALGVFFARQKDSGYLPDDTPEGVIYDYALALQVGDYERAYSYLADMEGKPTLAQFRSVFLERRDSIQRTALEVGEAHLIEGNEAWVDVVVIYSSGDIFDQGWRSNETAVLILQEDAWRIRSMPFPYWDWIWGENQESTPESKPPNRST